MTQMEKMIKAKKPFAVVMYNETLTANKKEREGETIFTAYEVITIKKELPVYATKRKELTEFRKLQGMELDYFLDNQDLLFDVVRATKDGRVWELKTLPLGEILDKILLDF